MSSVFGRVGRVLRSRWVLAYVALLVASHIVIILTGSGPPESPPEGYRWLELPRMTGRGPTGDEPFRLAVRHWAAPEQQRSNARPPVILLHGSPSGGASDFRDFAPLIASAGYDVFAPDLPGFGPGGTSAWVPEYSVGAMSHMVQAMMDAQGIERAHLVGWSLGGGTGIIVADREPERIASLTLLGAIGVQEGEGSGSYYFEHAKYGLGWVLGVALPEVVPHFGLLGDRGFRHAFIRNFWDTDQRPIRAMLERMQSPTLILHGRHDFLVPDWTAEEHHRIVGPSRLVMLDAGHFLPMAEPMGTDLDRRQTALVLLSFLGRHDAPGMPVLRGARIDAPHEPGPISKLGGFDFSRATPWWLLLLIIVLATFISEDLTVIAVGLLIVHGEIDFGVGLVGCFLGIVAGDLGLWAVGRYAGRRVLRWPLFRNRINEKGLERWGRIFDKHTGKAVFLSRCVPGTRLPTYVAAGILGRRTHKFFFWVAVAVFAWTPLLLVLTALIGPPLLSFFEEVLHGPWALLASFLVIYVVIRLLMMETTVAGRHRLIADMRRLRAVEFWPPWLFYLPLVPWFAMLALRYRGPMTFTCANPGIANGGGVVGESKTQILEGFGGRPSAMPWRYVEGGSDRAPEARAREVIDLVREDQALGGYPVILKPDVSQRGHGLTLAHDDQDVLRYFQEMTRPAQVQAYHPGPKEVGILWARVPSPGSPVDEWKGEIFSITRKVFPIIEGDGRSTLESLIWKHPRYQMQAKVFLKRYTDQTDRVLGKGERLRLAIAGNHVQGTMFCDGADLITEALTRRIDEIAQAYRSPEDGSRVDFGRFDIRYESDQQLREGRGFVVIEFNGTMSESTNLYDPSKPVLWTYGVLFRQWRRLFRIGAARRAGGQRPMSARQLVEAMRSHYRGRPGSGVSD